MQAQGLEWGDGYRALGREAIAAILQGQMAQAVDEHLDRMAVLDQTDRRNGGYRRHLLTELGDIELAVPRTRRFAPSGRGARLCAPSRARRSYDPGVLCPRAFGAQGQRSVAADPGASRSARPR